MNSMANFFPPYGPSIHHQMSGGSGAINSMMYPNASGMGIHLPTPKGKSKVPTSLEKENSRVHKSSSGAATLMGLQNMKGHKFGKS